MMLYPKTYNIKKSNMVIKLLLAISVLVIFTCRLINVLTYKDFDWATIVTLSIIYAWAAVIYAIRKHTNIAAHVLLHVILLIPFAVFLDNTIGYNGWSIRLAIPIILITANTIMFVLTIVARKRYMRYAFCHLIIFLLSFIPIVLFITKESHELIFTIISSSIALATFITTSIMCGRALVDAAGITFHM